MKKILALFKGILELFQDDSVKVVALCTIAFVVVVFLIMKGVIVL